MNNLQNQANTGDGINIQTPQPFDAHNQVVTKNLADDALKMQCSIPCPQEIYRGNISNIDSDESLVLLPLPQGHTFLVTRSLMQMIIARVCFKGYHLGIHVLKSQNLD